MLSIHIHPVCLCLWLSGHRVAVIRRLAVDPWPWQSTCRSILGQDAESQIAPDAVRSVCEWVTLLMSRWLSRPANVCVSRLMRTCVRKNALSGCQTRKALYEYNMTTLNNTITLP